ncbi:VIT1/CCC1 transporter family protein [Celeribacter marinus]|uniref:Integral membrane protein n=1 Tax=Celeribacter marinus TaxID=1397108 RepID=A0A0N9ZWZ8_9RHOB|nr:VIT1/CCC1 transporter family protein [Celeribacter marinus]ALI54580.1 integral membrane protein [Celeribacter marinus]SFK50051.1 Predicted Fe2+/Mn2+ transporter, VIT1/CCC1 family [Celeribacter marinus]
MTLITRFTDHLKQIVYGGNDGIVTTFAIVAGFAGAESQGAAQIGALAVLLFGLANLFADAASMGLGEFLSARAARDMIKRRRATLARDPASQVDALTAHLKSRGLSSLDATTMASLTAKSPELMAELTLSQVDGIEDPGQGPLWPRALVTFVSFVVFGAIPLLPYLLGLPVETQTPAAIVATFSALGLLGVLRHVATRAGLVRCMGETIAVGGLCAGVAYGVGLLVAGG